MIPVSLNPVRRLKAGIYVQLIEETSKGDFVRVWDFDEQWNMIPTARVIIVRKEDYEPASPV